MTIEEFVAMCNKKDWPELVHFLSSNIKDLSFKIAVSAFIDIYHPDAEQKKTAGLSGWDTKLSAELVTPALSLYTSAVDLSNFTNAYILATNTGALNDAKVGDVIVAYVKANKKRFGPSFFESKRVDDELKEMAKKAFGDFNFSKPEREAYFRQQFNKQAQDKITYLQALDRVTEQLGKVLNIRLNHFRVSFPEPASESGLSMFSMPTDGKMGFDKSISPETIKQYSETLEKLGIKVNFYDMSWCRKGTGIQLYEKPEELAKKLEQILIPTAINESPKKLTM